jgi:hypothetical protein
VIAPDVIEQHGNYLLVKIDGALGLIYVDSNGGRYSVDPLTTMFFPDEIRAMWKRIKQATP